MFDDDIFELVAEVQCQLCCMQENTCGGVPEKTE